MYQAIQKWMLLWVWGVGWSANFQVQVFIFANRLRCQCHIFMATLSIFYTQQVRTGKFLPCRRKKNKYNFPAGWCRRKWDHFDKFKLIDSYWYTDAIKKVVLSSWHVGGINKNKSWEAASFFLVGQNFYMSEDALTGKYTESGLRCLVKTKSKSILWRKMGREENSFIYRL